MADFQQVNVAGIEPLGNPAMRDLIDTLRKGYEAFQTPKNTQLAQQKAQEDITAQALKNALEKQYGPQREAANLGLTKEQMRDLALRNAVSEKIGPQDIQSQIALRNAQAIKEQANSVKLQQIAELLRRRTQGLTSNGQQMSTLQSVTQQPMQQPMQQIPSQTQGPSGYEDAALLQMLLGGRTPQVIDVDGKKIYASPFGSGVLSEGLSPYEKEFQTESAKSQVKAIDDLNTRYSALNDSQTDLDFMIDTIRSNPELAKQSLGPLQSVGTKWFGTGEAADIWAAVNTSSNNLVTDMAQRYKGAFRIGEQALAKDTKAGPKDTFAVLTGKLIASSYLTELTKQRIARAAELMSGPEHLSETKALAKAKDEIDGEDLLVKSKLSLGRNITSKELSKLEFKDDAEMQKFYSNLTPAQLNHLNTLLQQQAKQLGAE